MRFSVDLESLTEICLLAKTTAALSEESALIANTIVSHSDWNCNEKRLIDECICSLKGSLNGLQQEMNNFSEKFSFVRQELNSLLEKNLLAARNLDNTFSSNFAVSTTETIGQTDTIKEYLDELNNVRAQNRLDNYTAGSMGETLKVCRFEDIILG